jgi:N-acetylglucosamine-6-sulfatase
LRRTLAALTLFFTAAFVMSCSGTAADAPSKTQRSPEKPNFVFVLADDMRADEFEHMPQTRQLLAEQGLMFENAFVSHSLCCPSRASLLRGQYTHNHQVLTNRSPEGGFEKFRSQGHEDSTIATSLKSSGYQTVLLGKYLNGYPGCITSSCEETDDTYVPPGWDEWYGWLGEGYYYDYRLNENGSIVSYGDAEEDYYTDVLARQTKAYLQRAAGSSDPFFMYVAPNTPHGPFEPAPRHEDEYEDLEVSQPPSFDEVDVNDKPAWVQDFSRLDSADETKVDDVYRRRQQMLLSLDEMMAGLIEELRATDQLDNTYVFFTSDNGYHLGEHRFPRGKRTVYEEAVRVPLAVRGPKMPPATTVKEMALINVDFAPTIAELAGVSTPTFVDGRSLAPLLSGTPPESWRTAVLLEHWSGPGPEIEQAPTYTAVKTEKYKYVEYDTGDKELYDLSSDPYELENLYDTADSALIEGLKSRLEALKACSEASCRAAEEGP